MSLYYYLNALWQKTVSDVRPTLPDIIASAARAIAP
jgi:hypothetical protein